ncbi:protein of unknown function [Legionella micdadei]|uniref:Uncharacterized protein n=2 Tax=Legionella micdadei TaxID=451 RepID=A0A098GDR3_LEGMI|nr:Pyridine nucleotide-disulfide oxidoreductase [Legionella micdadei]CEG59581.1 protein of unknown function [Legionella micdadei]SCX94320.1 hypothetical protein SAMN02982997_00449 [Legionella micdadei]
MPLHFQSEAIFSIMSKVVICGAGPIGLYLAIRLKQKGVKNIVVYDPRAGEYTRPGHLNQSVFATAETGLGIKIWDYTKTGHIKDLEKKLYKEACNLKIQIEKQRFVEFNAKKKGVVVKDLDENQTDVESYMVFDCTGSRREVIKAFNVVQPNYFTLKPIINENDIFVKNHFLAYVKMDPSDYLSLRDSDYLRYDSDMYVTYMQKFREFGWKEFAPPYFYEVNFGKNKVCMYVEHPDNLSQDLHGQWLQTVLEFHSNDPAIKYELCPPSKKGLKKPRFNAFTVNPQELSAVVFNGSRRLPAVAAQGDAQIDFNHRLAHGVEDGFERIETFLKDLDIIDGIIYFDGDTAEEHLKPELATHREKLVRHYARQKEEARKALIPAKKQYLEIIAATGDADKKLALQETLKVIDARISYTHVTDKLSLCEDSHSKQLSADDLALLDEIYRDYTNANDNLPEYYENFRATLPEIAARLARHYKTVATDLFQKNRFSEAIDAYKKALQLYQSKPVHLEKIIVISNLILCYKNLGEVRDSIELVQIALAYPNSDREITLKKEKMAYNFIRCIADALERGETFSEDLPLLIKQSTQHLSQKSKGLLRNSLVILTQHGCLDMKEASFTVESAKIAPFFKVANGSADLSNLSALGASFSAS